MTYEQIIINKMDKPKRYCEGIDCAWCNEKEPCIYKIANELEEKLLRKEQECERLKEEVSLLKESNSKLQQIEDVNSLEKCYLQQIDQLKAENEKLNAEKVKYYQQTLDDEIQINELLQTLTEIKEIAEENFYFLDYYYIFILEKILQKISEVIK